jgi:selenocysteine lyase/cysteine desulfurase
MLGIHGLNASLSLLQEVGVEKVATAVLDNAQYLIQGIRANPDLELLTPQDPLRHAGIVTFRHRHADSRALWRGLLERQVICACRGGGIRFSGHFYNTPQELERALEWAIRLARR